MASFLGECAFGRRGLVIWVFLRREWLFCRLGCFWIALFLLDYGGFGRKSFDAAFSLVGGLLLRDPLFWSSARYSQKRSFRVLPSVLQMARQSLRLGL